jgi:limonene-1,2-epoxide hydrolase
MKTEMNAARIGMANLESLVRTVLMALREGQIDNAVNHFGEQFAFHDYGIGLEFRDKRRLTEFFQKRRELHADPLLLTDTIFVSGDHVISEWTQQYTAAEAFLPGPLKAPISLRGASIVRIEHGKIVRWSDYYNGPHARRTSLASYFTDGWNSENEELRPTSS